MTKGDIAKRIDPRMMRSFKARIPVEMQQCVKEFQDMLNCATQLEEKMLENLNDSPINSALTDNNSISVDVLSEGVRKRNIEKAKIRPEQTLLSSTSRHAGGRVPNCDAERRVYDSCLASQKSTASLTSSMFYFFSKYANQRS